MSTIVYIDDEEIVCRAIALSLRGCGHQLVTFCDPRAALEHIRANPPALIICDYRMPGLDGLEVLDNLELDVPFVLISGYLSVELPDDPRLVKLLSKPVRPEELLEVVETFAGQASTD